MNQRKNMPPQVPCVPAPRCQQTGQPHLHKPGVMQPRAVNGAQPRTPPVAPPVYRPEVKKFVQPKMAAASGTPRPPQAPPVYRPQPTPKVLQAKTANNQPPRAGQSPRQPVAPPVYRPEQRSTVQPKMMLQPRKPPQAPPVYRPEQKRIVQPKMAATIQAHKPAASGKILRLDFVATSAKGQAPGRQAAPRPAFSRSVVQCVGGPKFGLQAENSNDADVIEGINALKQIQSTYKNEIKTAKQKAIDDFNKSEKMDDIDTQTLHTAELKAAEMTPEGLKAKLKGPFSYDGNNILYKNKKVAVIKTEGAAYTVSQAAGNGAAAVYKKHTLDGLSNTEYVDVHGKMVRRYAYRGITPPERKAYKTGATLVPQSKGHETEGLMGYNYDDATGQPKQRARDVEQDKITDLEWLNKNAKTNLNAVPNNPLLLAFMQTRKGVGKALSVTSTPRAITSNHGASFTGFGQIKIDLAKVDTAYISHTYKDAPFDPEALIGLVGSQGKALEYTTTRANETVLRNRELVLTQIPNAAVVGLTDTNERKAYEAEFRLLYTPQYKKFYKEALDKDDTNFVVPAPTEFPYVEDHFTLLQARADSGIIINLAREAAKIDAQPRNEYVEAYKKQYDHSWQAEYEEAAWTKLIDNDSSESPNVPPSPKPDNIPGVGVGGQLGISDGKRDGKADGGAAGRNHPIPKAKDDSKEQPVEKIMKAPKKASAKKIKSAKKNKNGSDKNSSKKTM